MLTLRTIWRPADLKRAEDEGSDPLHKRPMTPDGKGGVRVYWMFITLMEVFVNNWHMSSSWSYTNHIHRLKMSNLFKNICSSLLVFLIFEYLCLILRLSKICFGLCKHAGRRPSLLKNVISKRRVCIREIKLRIYRLPGNLLFPNIVLCNRFHVWPQIKDVRQTESLVFVPSCCVRQH